MKKDNQTVTLEKLEFDRHHKLISNWLQKKQVRKWWGDPESRLNQIEKATTDNHALICVSGVPVGYICWQPVDRQDLDIVGLYDVPDHLIDIDLFLADPEFRGQGIGPKALEILFHQFRNNTAIRIVGLATSIENKIAIHAFEKSGFKKKYQFESPLFGLCWHMEQKIVD